MRKNATQNHPATVNQLRKNAMQNYVNDPAIVHEMIVKRVKLFVQSFFCNYGLDIKRHRFRH